MLLVSFVLIEKAVDDLSVVPYDLFQHWKGGDSKIYEFLSQ